MTVARRDASLLAVAVIAMAFLLSQLIDFGFGRDQGIYAVVARTIGKGGAPYRDAWDFKPPGIYFVYAAASALFGESVRAIRVLEAASWVALAAAFMALSRHYVGDWRAGVLSAALAILGHVELEFWHTAQPESFGAVFVAWGLVFAAAAIDRSGAAGLLADTPGSKGHFSRLARLGLWWAVGVSAGCAALLKPTIGIALASSLAIGIARSMWKGDGRARLRSAADVVAGFALGVLVVLAGCAAFFASRDGMTALEQALFAFAPRYAKLAWENTTAVDVLWRLVRGWLFTFSAANSAGLVCLLIPAASGRAGEGIAAPVGRLGEGILHIGGAIALLLAGVFVQARLFAYHFGTVLPLTALLAGWGFWRLWLALRGTWHGALTFALLVLSLVAWRSATPDLPDSFAQRCIARVTAWTDAAKRQDVRDRLYTVLDYHARDNRLAGEWLLRQTPPEEAVFVYGFTPELYFASRRTPASRYIYDVPQRARWSRDEAREQLMRELQSREPSAIIVEHGDLVTGVTGVPRDSASDLQDFTALGALLASRYVRLPAIGKFDVYRRAG